MHLPAFEILRRAHDEIVGGKRRFRAKEIKDILAENGFQVHTLSYHYPLLFIFILLRKLFGTDRNKNNSDLAPISPLINGVLFLLHRIENEIIKTGFPIPFGSSLFVVAKKRVENQASLENSQAYAQSDIVSKTINYIKSITILNQLFKYSIVGIFNTVFGLGVIYLLFNLFHCNYILSNIGGYAVGLINGFIWNKKWTFGSRRHYFKEIIPYLSVFGISYAVNLIVVVFFVEALKVHPNIAQILGIAAYSMTNFMVNKYWTFAKVS
jgi:putative flippase GtrA